MLLKRRTQIVFQTTSYLQVLSNDYMQSIKIETLLLITSLEYLVTNIHLHVSKTVTHSRTISIFENIQRYKTVITILWPHSYFCYLPYFSISSEKNPKCSNL